MSKLEFLAKTKKKKVFWLLLFLFSAMTIHLLLYRANRSEKIPLYYSYSKMPVISGSINKKPYYFGIDTGSTFHLSMPKHILQNIDKVPFKTFFSKDGFGNRYKSQGYLLKEFRVGNLEIDTIEVCEKSPDFYENTNLWSDERSRKKFTGPKLTGTIGIPLLESSNTYFHFPKNEMAFIRNSSDLKKYRIDLTSFTAIPFENTDYGIIIEIGTDLGIRKFSVDTGSTENFFRSSLITHKELKQDPIRKILFFATTHRFKLGNMDYGPEELCSLEISEEFPIDGMLGMAFLRKHEVFIDYRNSILYLR